MENIELQEAKVALIARYNSLGGRDDLTNDSIKAIMREISHLEELSRVKSQLKQNNQPVQDSKEKHAPIQANVGTGRENANMAALAMQTLSTLENYSGDFFDERELDDARFARSNSLNRLAADSDKDSVVILRDEEGRWF